jgi:hypothetical protein
MDQLELDFKKKSKKPRFTRQRIAKFFEKRYGVQKGRSVAKRFRRLKKYKNKGQYRKGVFYCKDGRPITEERINQYEKMCHKAVRQFLPALALYEKSYNYDDLVISCRREVFLALLDGFNPSLAFTVRAKDLEKRKLAEHEKRLNSEKNIVWGRLLNWVRRERHKYSPKELGGRTEALEVFVDGQLRNNEYSRGCYSEIDSSIPEEIHEIKDRLLEVLETEGPNAVLKAYEKLSGYDAERVVQLLTRSDNPLAKMMPDDPEDSKEYNNLKGR